jgi:RimJ/RimL family protein N-acetyltransferase
LTFLLLPANIASIRLVTGLGAHHEATLREAEPEGDLHIYALFADSSPIWKRIRGKILKPSAVS